MSQLVTVWVRGLVTVEVRGREVGAVTLLAVPVGPLVLPLRAARADGEHDVVHARYDAQHAEDDEAVGRHRVELLQVDHRL